MRARKRKIKRGTRKCTRVLLCRRALSSWRPGGLGSYTCLSPLLLLRLILCCSCSCGLLCIALLSSWAGARRCKRHRCKKRPKNAPPVSLSCSSRSSGVFLRWFCRLPPVSLACSSSLVCSSCVSPVSSSRAWVSGKKVAEGGPTQSPESSEESFPRALKSFQNRSKMAPRRLENRSKMAPGGLPGASREPKLIFDAFLASLGALLGAPGALLGWSWDLLGRSRALLGRSWGSFWPPGGHFFKLFGRSFWRLAPGPSKIMFFAVFLHVFVCCCGSLFAPLLASSRRPRRASEL